MKTETFKCNTCEKEYSTDKEMLRIGDYQEDNLFIRNPFPNSRLLAMDNHDAIHFCSKACFMEFFFIDENRE
jgi:hypothetical protein